MKDTIYRQMAIQKMKDLYNEDLDAYGVEIPEMFDCDRAIEALQSLQPAEPEYKIGKWIATEKGLVVTVYECSECKRHVMDDTGYDVAKDYPFCHCGAKMRGEDNV